VDRVKDLAGDGQAVGRAGNQDGVGPLVAGDGDRLAAGGRRSGRHARVVARVRTRVAAGGRDTAGTAAAGRVEEVAGAAAAAEIAAGQIEAAAAVRTAFGPPRVALDLPRVGHLHQVAELRLGVPRLDELARVGERLALLLVALD